MAITFDHANDQILVDGTPLTTYPRPFVEGYVPARFHGCTGRGCGFNSAVYSDGTGGFSQNITSYFPWFTPWPLTYVGIYMWVTVGRANTTVQFGLYDSDDEGCPKNLVEDIATISDVSTTGQKATNFSAKVKPAGHHWMGVLQANGTPVNVEFQRANASCAQNNVEQVAIYALKATTDSSPVLLPVANSGSGWGTSTALRMSFWVKGQ